MKTESYDDRLTGRRVERYSDGYENPAAVDETARHDGYNIFFMAIVGAMTIIPCVIAWFVAKMGGRYRLIKFILFPAGFMISNLLMFMPLLVFAFVTGKGDLCWDMSMIETVFLPIGIALFSWLPGIDVPAVAQIKSNVGIVIMYQVGVWWFLGRWANRNLAMGIYDGATTSMANAQGVSPGALRVQRAGRDNGYMKDAMFYEKKGTVPPLGIITVPMHGGDLGEYYGV